METEPVYTNYLTISEWALNTCPTLVS